MGERLVYVDEVFKMKFFERFFLQISLTACILFLTIPVASAQDENVTALDQVQIENYALNDVANSSGDSGIATGDPSSDPDPHISIEDPFGHQAEAYKLGFLVQATCQIAVAQCRTSVTVIEDSCAPIRIATDNECRELSGEAAVVCAANSENATTQCYAEAAALREVCIDTAVFENACREYFSIFPSEMTIESIGPLI